MEPAGQNTVRIDGDRIKSIRMEKGLTQLYLASWVGVTTETISRWENRKTPAIKRENAIRLAQALEVELDEILQKTGPADSQMDHPGKWHDKDSRAIKQDSCQQVEGARPRSGKRDDTVSAAAPPAPFPLRQVWPYLIGITLVLLAVTAGVSLVSKQQAKPEIEPDDIDIIRVLPASASPGAQIPVLLELDSFAPEKIAMVITEMIPPGTRTVSVAPPLKKQMPDQHILKWIVRLGEDETTLAYLLQIPERINGNETELHFHGKARIKTKTDSIERSVEGDSSINIARCYWADIDCNGRIDDGEILAAYDRYGSIKIFDKVLQEAENIWVQGGYQVDTETGRISIKENPYQEDSQKEPK